MSALSDRITEVLLAHDRCAVPCRWTTAETWAAHVAERIEAELQLTEEARIDIPGRRGINPVRRWVSAWSEVADERGSLGFRPCDGCTRTNCEDVCPSWPSDVRRIPEGQP